MGEQFEQHEKMGELIQLFPQAIHTEMVAFTVSEVAFDGANALTLDPDFIGPQEPYEPFEPLNEPTPRHLHAVPDLAETELPEMIPARGIEIDRVELHRIIKLASVAMPQTVEVRRINEKPTNLMDDIHDAKHGDKLAESRVDMNCFTDAVERSYKDGIIISIGIEDKDGELQQFNQPLKKIYANTLAYAGSDPLMNERGIIETENGIILQQAYDDGLLDDYVFVTFSLVSNKVKPEKSKELGFFTETMSASIQIVSKEDSAIKLESIFVAGVEQDGAERHDFDTVIQVAAEFGEDYSGLDAEQILARPMLIRKDKLKNGKLDLLKKYDDVNGTKFGKAYSGPELTIEDYKELERISQERQENMRGVADRIKARLLAESNQIKTPIQAVRRLDKISEEETLGQSIVDKSIDPIVFGTESAGYIVQARASLEAGNWHAMQQMQKKALSTASSSSCPSSMKQDQMSETNNIEGINNMDTTEETKACIEIKDGQSVKCPSCKETVKAIVPDRSSIYCPNSKCSLVAPWLKKGSKVEKPKKEKSDVINIFKMNCEPTEIKEKEAALEAA